MSFFAGLLLVLDSVYAQTFDNIKDQKPFKISGGIGGGTEFFTSNEPVQSRDPFAWNVYGHLNPSVYGFSFPFSFTISQYSKSFTQPFTQMGISPSYKWAKLHLGYRSMEFSPFVFDGSTFLGAGLELTPGKFYLGGFWGRLNKAIAEDTTANMHTQPQYARKGFGLKIGMISEKLNFNFQYFNAKDDTASIHRYNDSLTNVLPQSNHVLGTTWKIVMFKKLTLTMNSAASLLNRNLTYERSKEVLGIPSFFTKLFPITNSSQLSWSAEAQLALQLKNFNAMAGYRRIQPDFVSLGIPYMLNDIEMINANLGANIFKGRLNLNTAFVHQHNNLGNMLSSEIATMTGNFSANALISQNFFLSTNLTAVNVLQKDGKEKLTDTTRMNQLMISLVVAPTLNFSNSNTQHGINTSFTYTDLNDKNPLTTTFTSSDNINASANYSLYFLQKYFGINTGIQYSIYRQKESNYQSLGVNLGLNTQLLKNKNLSLQGDVGYFLNKDSQSESANNTTFSFSSNYTVKQQHSLGLFVSYILTPPINLNPLDDIYNVPYSVNSKMLSGGISYSYNF